MINPIIKSVNVNNPLIAYINPHIDEEMCKNLANKKCSQCYGKGSVKKDNCGSVKNIIVCDCVIKNYRKYNDKQRKP